MFVHISLFASVYNIFDSTISAPEKFDLILSAETLYTAEALEKVAKFQ